jgi:hypothetical protein
LSIDKTFLAKWMTARRDLEQDGRLRNDRRRRIFHLSRPIWSIRLVRRRFAYFKPK